MKDADITARFQELQARQIAQSIALRILVGEAPDYVSNGIRTAAQSIEEVLMNQPMTDDQLRVVASQLLALVPALKR